MAKKVSLGELKVQLVYAEARAYDNDFIMRLQARDDIKRLKTRIARREREEAYRDLGMKKVKGSLGGTYYE